MIQQVIKRPGPWMWTIIIGWLSLAFAEAAMARFAPGAPSLMGTGAELAILLAFALVHALFLGRIRAFSGPFSPGFLMLLITAAATIAGKGLVQRRYPVSPGDLFLLFLVMGFVGEWVERKLPRLAAPLAALMAPAFIAMHSLELGYYKGGRATAIQMMVTALPLVAGAGIVTALVAFFKRQGAPFVAAALALLFSISPATETVTKDDGPPPVVMITVDTLRFDEATQLSSYQRLAKDGLEFVDALAPAGWTLPSMGTIATGTWPSVHGAHRQSNTWPSHGLMKPELQTLGEAMKQAGYKTGGMVSNPNLDVRFGFKRGMNTWHNLFRDPPTIYFGLGLLKREANFEPAYRSPHDGALIVDESLRFVDEQGQDPFFLWVHTLDCHLPYYHAQISQDSPLHGTFGSRPNKMLNVPMLRMGRLWFNNPMRDALLAMYREELNYIDGHLNRLLDGLKERGLYDKSLIILTSDHGEEFLDHGNYEHGHTLYDELVHIPMVVKVPNSQRGQIREDPVGLIDIMPTIAAVSGAKVAPTVQGHSMLRVQDDSRPRFLLGNLYAHQAEGVVVGQWKLIQEDGIPGNYKLYDRDEGEMEDVSAQNPEIVQQLAQLLQSRGASDQEEPELDLDGLRALGYLD